MAVLFLCGISAASTISQLPPKAEPIVITKLAAGPLGRDLEDGKWGYVAQLQEGLNRQAAACGFDPIEADGFYSKKTAAALQAAQACLNLPVTPDLTDIAFEHIAGAPAPSAATRARSIVRTLEGTDYDHMEWNVCTKWAGDRASVMTWGPYGKTLGWGGELLDLLRKLPPETVDRAFREAGAQGLDDLMSLRQARAGSKQAFPGARALMERICTRKGQKAAWEDAFARLGAEPVVRSTYDEEIWGDGAWFRKVADRLDASWRKAGLEPTEVDYAFFLDRAIHMGWGSARFKAVDAALETAARAVGPGKLTNAQARFYVSHLVRAKAHPRDRMARDVVFLVDAEEELKPLMAATPGWPQTWRAAWARRSGLKASDAGLSDARAAPAWEEAAPVAEGEA
jgi:peptidoglycan hydrolase-like protein with peptidoglycan-binding domain